MRPIEFETEGLALVPIVRYGMHRRRCLASLASQSRLDSPLWHRQLSHHTLAQYSWLDQIGQVLGSLMPLHQGFHPTLSPSLTIPTHLPYTRI